MELRTLRYLLAVVESGSVTGAARGLHIAQPSLSRQIRQLEAELGVDLFIREKGRLRLSAAGVTFMPAARAVVVQADEAHSLAHALATGELITLRIAAPPTTVADVIAPFIATFASEDPLPYLIETCTGQDTFDALAGQADIAVGPDDPSTTWSTRVIAVLPCLAYVNARHPWARRKTINIEELTSEPLILTPVESIVRRLLDGALIIAGVGINQSIEVRTPRVAQALAAAGRGVAVVSDDPRYNLQPLVIIASGTPITLTLKAAWDPHHHGAETIAAMARRLEAFCKHRYHDFASSPR